MTDSHWTFTSEPLSGLTGQRFVLSSGGEPVTFRAMLTALRDNAKFRSTYNDLLGNLPHSAFRWETPGVTERTIDRPFEFVVHDAPGLDRRPDVRSFREHFPKAERDVCVFPNLSGRSLLIAPAPVAEHNAYPHLAAFVRNAPDVQRDALWQAVGTEILNRIGSKPVWLSTAGAGVAWLHIRLDDSPKYYRYRAYKTLPIE